MNLCLFETTSLYGSTKQTSQYDGMKPYIRYRGLTESDMVPMMHGPRYHTLKDYVESFTGDLLAGDTSTTSRKLRTFTKIIALTKAALNLMGLPGGYTRLPLVDATDAQIAQLREDLRAGGVTLRS